MNSSSVFLKSAIATRVADILSDREDVVSSLSQDFNRVLTVEGIDDEDFDNLCKILAVLKTNESDDIKTCAYVLEKTIKNIMNKNVETV